MIDCLTLKHDRTDQRFEPNFVFSFILGFQLEKFVGGISNVQAMPETGLLFCNLRHIVTYSNADGLA